MPRPASRLTWSVPTVAAAVGLLLAAGSASAATGFTVTPKLSPAASFVAGKPVTVECATSRAAWDRFLASTGRAGWEANGSAVPGSAVVSLSPAVCLNLLVQLHHPLVRPEALGPSILVLVHEAIHDRGVTNEGVTDCDAVHELPRVAMKFFSVQPGRQLRAVMAAASAFRARETAVYRSVC